MRSFLILTLGLASLTLARRADDIVLEDTPDFSLPPPQWRRRRAEKRHNGTDWTLPSVLMPACRPERVYKSRAQTGNPRET